MAVQSSLCLMADMVRDRAISPVELVESHLKQIEAQNQRLLAKRPAKKAVPTKVAVPVDPKQTGSATPATNPEAPVNTTKTL